MADFEGFDVKVDLRNAAHEFVPVPNAVIVVRDVTAADPATGAGAIALDDIVADGAGVVASGALPVAAGRTIRFTWFRELDGRCGSVTRVTT